MLVQFLCTFTMWDPKVESYSENRASYEESFDCDEVDDLKMDRFFLIDNSWYVFLPHKHTVFRDGRRANALQLQVCHR